MKFYTLDNIIELDPCHTRKKLESYMEGRKRISLSGIMSSKAYDRDKIWLVVKLLPTDKAIEFAKWCADSVSHIDNRYAARSAACAADARAEDAADDAAYAARAAWDADAACAGAYASGAASDAARAWDVYFKARKEQVNQLKLIVKENKL